ncbi:unnamed protein product [Hermetia illucens]|uniref:Uncharacterized protein n=1 Tax=Hermetia illucens TaxID=343691 RepID=A0A7R8V272_HERIL|nr:uncharacterized protein LOC119656691 [Hermetia illucens]CAD7091466.1 unnamed protein product [Hermetia illucens]
MCPLFDMVNILLWISFFGFGAFSPSECRPRVRITQISFDFDVKLGNGTTWLTDDRTVNVVFDLKKGLKTMKSRFKVDLIRRQRTFNAIANATRDYCAQTPIINKIWAKFSHVFLQTSNFPSTCPIPKNTYYVRNLSFPEQFLPNYMPALDFVVETTFLHRMYFNQEEVLLKYVTRGKLIP